MAITLTIVDEELTGRTANELSVDFLTEHITVRELIRSRVYQEVSDHNAKPHPTEFRGLIQPSDAQIASGSYRGNHGRPIDWKQQFEKAVAAFEQRQILILMNGRQLETLDDAIELRPDTTVTFLRLTLLVGAERARATSEMARPGTARDDGGAHRRRGGTKPICPRSLTAPMVARAGRRDCDSRSPSASCVDDATLARRASHTTHNTITRQR